MVREGKGDGPVASALNRRPPDLTTLAKRNGGRFPTDRVDHPSLVTANLPWLRAHRFARVWGPIFQALDPQDRMNRIRIENVRQSVYRVHPGKVVVSSHPSLVGDAF